MFKLGYNTIVMENEVLSLIRQKKMIKAGETIGVAVSGGKDSMALLHYLKTICYDIDFEIEEVIKVINKYK